MTPEGAPLGSILSMQTHNGALPRRRSGQLGDNLLVFLRRPGAGGTSPHITQSAERKREFCNIVAARRIDEDDEVAVAAGEIKTVSYTHLRAHETRHDL